MASIISANALILAVACAVGIVIVLLSNRRLSLANVTVDRKCWEANRQYFENEARELQQLAAAAQSGDVDVSPEEMKDLEARGRELAAAVQRCRPAVDLAETQRIDTDDIGSYFMAHAGSFTPQLPGGEWGRRSGGIPSALPTDPDDRFYSPYQSPSPSPS